MESFTPSYLFKNRFGIYYFRVRVPSHLKQKHGIIKTEIRKSLRTSNRSEALAYARKMWVSLSEKEFQTSAYPPSKPEQQYCHRAENKPYECTVNNALESGQHALPIFQANNSATNQQQPFVVLGPQDPATTPAAEPAQSILLSEAYDEFYKWKSKDDWGETSKRKAKSVITQFIEIVGDKTCSELTQADMVNFRKIYLNLPKRIDQGQYKGKSCHEIAKMPMN
jgi:hypothetical protein